VEVIGEIHLDAWHTPNHTHTVNARQAVVHTRYERHCTGGSPWSVGDQDGGAGCHGVSTSARP
jgi:hypothetical protein